MNAVARWNARPFLLCAGLLGAWLSGCVTHADERTEDGGEAITTFSRWRSPLDVGTYDSDNATLVLFSYLDKQEGLMIDTFGEACDETAIDVVDGQARLLSTERPCTLVLSKEKAGIRVKGRMRSPRMEALADVDLHFEPRAPNAMVGRAVVEGVDGVWRKDVYVPKVVGIFVESSSNSGFTFTLEVDGVPRAAHAVAKLDASKEWYTTSGIDGCPADQIILVTRRDGRFSFEFMPTRGQQCFKN
jgi:hypothetical protein